MKRFKDLKRNSEEMSNITSEATQLYENTKDFYTDSVNFINRCTKPDKKGNFFDNFMGILAKLRKFQWVSRGSPLFSLK